MQFTSICMDYTILLLLKKEPYSCIFSCLSNAIFDLIVSNLYVMFKGAIDREDGFDSFASNVAQMATMTAWISFPAIWYLQKNLFIEFQQGDTMFCIADILAKVFLTLILVNTTVEQA